MEYLYLVFIIICLSGQNNFMKLFNKKTEAQKNPSLLYLLCMSAASILLITCASGFRLVWDSATFGFSVIFGTCFAATVFFNVLAIKYGPLSLTSLITAYSLIIPTMFGIFFLDEPVSPYLAVGIVLLMVSLLLINLKKGGGEGSINIRWFVCVLIAFLGNASISCVQKYHQVLYPGKFRFEFMAFAMCIVFVISVTALLVTRTKVSPDAMQNGLLFASPAGMMNAVVNLLVMTVASVLPASLVYPVVSAGGIVLTSCLALTVYREKLTRWQIAGLVIGIASVVFLNLT